MTTAGDEGDSEMLPSVKPDDRSFFLAIGMFSSLPELHYPTEIVSLSSRSS